MITIDHPTVSRVGHINKVLAHPYTRPILLASLDLAPSARAQRAADLERVAIQGSTGNDPEAAERSETLLKLSGVLRLLSAQDITAIRAQAVQEEAKEGGDSTESR
ncbi:hypothetical protein [Burkholderia multivorans]|uniref:hypothetical protein n=1 Tax=Burkholderia multivorans TaxID=87883 RepID=UPI001BA3FB00|nr:hypothetical protein [Burkholderia multivorans]MBR8019535.1 hypothetical protein [Burkholderia multivorans]MBU9647839.1 hypothetical protein [Burkholderia multivorans]MDN7756786.1 hypothetical protein [Burkholderia multivorans]MDN8008206.1 hypothetical protein [Burkholderia multivorans]HEF4729995.1 hypothetical protein [Burkholderia multivorans]